MRQRNLLDSNSKDEMMVDMNALRDSQEKYSRQGQAWWFVVKEVCTKRITFVPYEMLFWCHSHVVVKIKV
ncbi:unnamed protein product [Prunus armeniaca]|uniref:Uncharacterized protein n=1 Tax=Prunus armeniaca TaxID=36596 RepID=A0A6J5XMN7_PRUAR|nr:unnamed protein product [Prunus armeniaca]